MRIGVSDLYNGGGAVGGGQGAAVGTADSCVTCKDVGPAVLTAQNCPLAEYRKAAQRSRPAGAVHGIGKDAVIEGDVYAVMVPVKGHRLHIDIGVQQFGAADPDVGCSIQNLLGRGR